MYFLHLSYLIGIFSSHTKKYFSVQKARCWIILNLFLFETAIHFCWFFCLVCGWVGWYEASKTNFYFMQLWPFNYANLQDSEKLPAVGFQPFSATHQDEEEREVTTFGLHISYRMFICIFKHGMLLLFLLPMATWSFRNQHKLDDFSSHNILLLPCSLFIFFKIISCCSCHIVCQICTK